MRHGTVLSRGWTALLVVAVVVSLAVVAAPLLALADATRPMADALYALFAMQCHQLADRSLHIGGEPLAVCGRCFAIYLALALGLVAFARLRRQGRWLLPAAALLVAVDVGLGGTMATRIATGALFGLAGAFAVAGWRRGVVGLSDAASRVAVVLLLAVPLAACAAKQKKQQRRQIMVPLAAASQACKQACDTSKDNCHLKTNDCKRRCPADRPSTPYQNESAICFKQCELRCQSEWEGCVLNCPGAHYEGEPAIRPAVPQQPAPPTVIIQQVGGGCRSDVDCKGDRVCQAGECVSPRPAPAIVVPGGCSRDADCAGSKICVEGVCAEQAPAPGPVSSPPPAPTIDRAACDACVNECLPLSMRCNEGSMADCYRAGACMCRCRLAAGGCGVDEGELQRCITSNEAKAKGT